ncbi:MULTISPECIES: IS5 family transposase [Streptosporangium]|uniref:Transposase n=1 Tax=Streptosporangium brasiliense TaxID=47480 RepID=A0ABT9RJJ9_9ACTN|nr:IS5 family transposase [Streptosporangium brasiliense]MDP9868986.1 transposase [Streptosporangium brasiliense]
MTTLAVTRRFDLTDAQWAVLEPLLPVAKRPGRPSRWTKRQLIDGIRWRVRIGAPWRDVPECYGSWQAVYSLSRRWQRAGVWQRIVTGLQVLADTAGLLVWQVGVDSTICRAHQHAAGYPSAGSVKRKRPIVRKTSARFLAVLSHVGRRSTRLAGAQATRSPRSRSFAAT